MTDEETPSQRLDRLLKGARDQKYLTPKDAEFDPDRDRERARKAVQGIVEELRKALGAKGEVEIHEVRMDNDGEMTVEHVHTSKPEPPPQVSIGNEKMISMAMDLSPLEIIDDVKARHHGEMVLRSHDTVVKELSSLPDEHALPQFAVAMGQIVVKSGMSGAMIIAGQRGQGAIGPEDFQTAMVGVVGGVILSALRYGQQHPDALTLADGVDDTQISSAVETFLAGFHEENPPKEEQ